MHILCSFEASTTTLCNIYINMLCCIHINLIKSNSCINFMICGHVVLVNNYYYYSMKLKMDWTLINHVSHINSRSYTYIMYKCDRSSNNFIPGEVAFDQWARAPQAWGDHRSHVTILHLPLLQKQHCATCHPHQSLRETTKGDHSQPTVKGDHLCRSLQQVWPS